MNYGRERTILSIVKHYNLSNENYENHPIIEICFFTQL